MDLKLSETGQDLCNKYNRLVHVSHSVYGYMYDPKSAFRENAFPWRQCVAPLGDDFELPIMKTVINELFMDSSDLGDKSLLTARRFQ